MTDRKGLRHIEIKKYRGEIIKTAVDSVAQEEPLEIRLAYFSGNEVLQKNLAVTMRTPGHDYDLAMGFLLAEGIISNREDIVKITYLPHKDKESAGNRLLVGLAKHVEFKPQQLERNFYTSSSCGVCGKASIDSVFAQCEADLGMNKLQVSKDIITKLPGKLRAAQDLFKETGGIHAAGLFDKDGKLLLLREDVGRHNAVDKVIGAAWKTSTIDLTDTILQVSGRTSFELTQKALSAGIPILSAVGAPSSLAVDLAKESGMTLLGFVQKERFNIYSGGERVLNIE